eukprot:1920833-Alexandrium_andersonii.AAC.1
MPANSVLNLPIPQRRDMPRGRWQRLRDPIEHSCGQWGNIDLLNASQAHSAWFCLAEAQP